MAIEIEQEKKPEIVYAEYTDTSLFLNHIMSAEVPMTEVPIPEWGVKVGCRALAAAPRIELQRIGALPDKGGYDFRPHFWYVVLHGCVNPINKEYCFKEEHKGWLQSTGNGEIVQALAMIILNVSHMLFSPEDEQKK